MQIGITLGLVLGVVLLIVGGIELILAKKQSRKSKWGTYVMMAGILALITAFSNTLKLL